MITRRGFVSLLAAGARGQDELQALYDAHDWFELARAVTASSPVRMRAAVAAAFHQFGEAEKLLRRSARGGGHEAAEAHGHLINLYARAGMWRKAFGSVEAARKAVPGRADLENAAAFFGALARHPDQKTGRVRAVKLKRTGDGPGLVAEIAINGKPARYFWDTGANFSVTTESEAKRLGMAVEDSAAKVNNATGGSVEFRIAVAREVNVGGNRIAHVPFLIFGDDQQPFHEMTQEERGGIGLPVQMALRSMAWSGDELEFGFTGVGAGERNLCFDGLMPVTKLGVGGAEVLVQLDTGATTTDLWPPFAKRFAGVVAGGKREKRRVGGVGQNVDVESIVVEQLPVRVGGKAVVLRPAEVHVETTDGASGRYFGRVGMDLLRQGERVAIDFAAMRLELLG